ncbi:MAG: 50S ribosomal protein L29 [Cytophagaceae bacterium]|nr:50S ribosomal protein L29 [Cytophagaceae bacterium]
MKTKEIKALSVDDLKEKIAGEQETLKKVKFAHSISPIENPMKIRHTRKLVAKLKTELNSKISQSLKK